MRVAIVVVVEKRKKEEVEGEDASYIARLGLASAEIRINEALSIHSKRECWFSRKSYSLLTSRQEGIHSLKGGLVREF